MTMTDPSSVESLLDLASGFIPRDRSTLHQDLAAWLQNALASDEFPDGARIPSERQLSAALGVSRMTVRRALEQVIGQGDLHREVGSKIWRVRKRPLIEIDVSEFSGFTAQLLGSGLSVHTRSVAALERLARKDEREAFGLSSDAVVHEILRVRDVEGEPVLLERFVIPSAVAPSLASEDLHGSVYGLLRERFGRSPKRASHRILASSLDAASAELLGRRVGLAVLRLQRRTYDRENLLIEMSDDLLCSDRLSVATSGPVN